MENRFNLVDEPWIPVVDMGRVSLLQVFSSSEFRALGGNPVQKIALTKLLLAIAQAAATPADEKAWVALGAPGLAERCVDYLKNHHDRFFLYGERPFLQMPAIAKAEVVSFGAVMPEVSTGNAKVLSQVQVQRTLDDAERAVLLVCLMGFALGGKKTDNKVILTPGYQGKLNDRGKPSTGKPGPSLAFLGHLHSFILGGNIQETIWLNLLTTSQIEQTKMFPMGVGIAPWETMPYGENCPTAQLLKTSLMGRLVPLCRFCLLDKAGFHYSEGLAHPGYLDGVTDPSVAVDFSGKKPRVLWSDPEKRPWRELTSLLGFIEQGNPQGFQCLQVSTGLDRARDAMASFSIWSGGLRVSSNAGEQYVSGGDDFLESAVELPSEVVGELWYFHLKNEMEALDGVAKGLYGRVVGYFKEQKVDGKKNAAKMAAHATHLFWQLCERKFQDLVNCCEDDEASRTQRQILRRTFSAYLLQVYDQFCPRETARQLDAWAKCRPNNGQYLKQEV